MKEQVTDISKVLQDMTAEMQLMRETIDQQYAEIAKLNRNIGALNRQNARRTKKMQDLKSVCLNTRSLRRILATAALRRARKL